MKIQSLLTGQNHILTCWHMISSTGEKKKFVPVCLWPPAARRPSRKLLGLQRLQRIPGDPPLHEDPPHCRLPRAHPQSAGPERDAAQRPPRLQCLRKSEPLSAGGAVWMQSVFDTEPFLFSGPGRWESGGRGAAGHLHLWWGWRSSADLCCHCE